MELGSVPEPFPDRGFSRPLHGLVVDVHTLD